MGVTRRWIVLDRDSPVALGRTRVVVALMALVLVATIGGVVGWLIADGDDARTPSDAARAAVDDWITGVREQDPGLISSVYAEDATWRDEALDDDYTGRHGVRSAWGIFANVDESDAELVSVDTEVAVIRWTLDGYEDYNDFHLVGISVLELDGATVVAETVYYDCARSPVAASCANT
jgi:hypothetical protein